MGLVNEDNKVIFKGLTFTKDALNKIQSNKEKFFDRAFEKFGYHQQLNEYCGCNYCDGIRSVLNEMINE